MGECWSHVRLGKDAQSAKFYICALGSKEAKCLKWTSTQVSSPLLPPGGALVCGGCTGAPDAGSEDQRAEDHVSAGGHRRALLQPPAAPQHPGEPPLPQQHGAHHQPLHHPVAQGCRLLPRVMNDELMKLSCCGLESLAIATPSDTKESTPSGHGDRGKSRPIWSVDIQPRGGPSTWMINARWMLMMTSKVKMGIHPWDVNGTLCMLGSRMQSILCWMWSGCCVWTDLITNACLGYIYTWICMRYPIVSYFSSRVPTGP